MAWTLRDLGTNSIGSATHDPTGRFEINYDHIPIVPPTHLSDDHTFDAYLQIVGDWVPRKVPKETLLIGSNLQSVPSTLFEEEFDLASLLQDAGPLTEMELANHLDAVEMALMDKLRHKEGHLIMACQSIKEMQGEAQGLHSQIVELRQSLNRLKISVPINERQRTAEVLDLMEKVAWVSKARNSIGILLANEDYEGASQLIDELRRMVVDNKLMKIKALENLMGELKHMKKLVIFLTRQRLANKD